MTYLIEYLGEFEFIFETVLGDVSGDQMGYFEANKTESKISCLGTFKRGLYTYCFLNLNVELSMIKVDFALGIQTISHLRYYSIIFLDCFNL